MKEWSLLWKAKPQRKRGHAGMEDRMDDQYVERKRTPGRIEEVS
jgi:hypothetical protein